jgi:beta-xylosidase
MSCRPLSGNFGGSFYVAATSPTPEGPFTVQNSNMTMAHTAPGDFDLFVDDDGTGYLIYTSVNEVCCHSHACMMFDGS